MALKSLNVSKEDIKLVDKIIAYESGDMTLEQIIDFFSELVKNGMAWTLQGCYGRMAESLIDRGYLDRNGKVLQYPEDE